MRLQFPATVLEMKRAGRRANVTPDPEHREPFTEVLTMPVDGHYTDSAPVRKADDDGEWKPLSALVRQIVKNVEEKRKEGSAK
jgi:hypothetical protein